MKMLIEIRDKITNEFVKIIELETETTLIKDIKLLTELYNVNVLKYEN